MLRMFAALASAGLCALSGFSQALPTSQPNLIQIIREEIKVGHSYEHTRVESGWPAAFERAKSPNYYLALESITGPAEVWFVAPFDSHAALGESMKRESDDAVLSAELARLARADSEHLNALRSIHAVARKDLSFGSYPEMGKQRFFEVTIMRTRPGRGTQFDAAAKAFGAAAGRVSGGMSYRVYQVVAGMPTPSYIIFASHVSFSDFDSLAAEEQKVMKAFTPEERATLEKFGTEGLVSEETQRFRLDGRMSYVPKQIRQEDPDFWTPKKSAEAPPGKPKAPSNR